MSPHIDLNHSYRDKDDGDKDDKDDEKKDKKDKDYYKKLIKSHLEKKERKSIGQIYPENMILIMI